MLREEFNEKLSVLLDVLCGASSIYQGKLMVYGGDDTNDGYYFCIRKNKLYSYNVEFGIGENVLLYINEVTQNDIPDIFSEYIANKTCIIHISADF